METEGLLEIRMTCLDEAAAREVIDRCDEVPAERRGQNKVEREGSVIVITYLNKMWPYDIAEMADELALADEAQVAKVFSCI